MNGQSLPRALWSNGRLGKGDGAKPSGSEIVSRFFTGTPDIDLQLFFKTGRSLICHNFLIV